MPTVERLRTVVLMQIQLIEADNAQRLAKDVVNIDIKRTLLPYPAYLHRIVVRRPRIFQISDPGVTADRPKEIDR